jgi:PKD repeat protein
MNFAGEERMKCPILITGIVLLAACQPGGPVAPPVDPQSPPPPPPPPAYVNHPPTAQLTQPAIGREGSSFTFNADRSSDPDHDTLSYLWAFGDGVTASSTVPTVGHTYRDNGSYVVSVMVKDSHGASSTDSKWVTIANVEPQITLKIPDTVVVVGQPVEIDVQYFDPGVDDSAGASLWISREGMGGGSDLPGPGKVTTTFGDPDHYTISVIAWDKDGAVVQVTADHPLVVVAAKASPVVAGRIGGRP